MGIGGMGEKHKDHAMKEFPITAAREDTGHLFRDLARLEYQMGRRIIVIFENESGRQWLYFFRGDRDLGEFHMKHPDLKTVQVYEMTGLEW